MLRWLQCFRSHVGGRLSQGHSLAIVPPPRRLYSASRETTTKTGITNPSHNPWCRTSSTSSRRSLERGSSSALRGTARRRSCSAVQNATAALLSVHQDASLQRQFRLLHSTRRLDDTVAAVATRTAPTDAESTESVLAPPPPILWTTHRLNTQQIAKVDAIFHKILWLDLFETSMLNDLVNERLGLTMTPKQRNQLSQFMEARASGTSLSSTAASASEQPEEVKPVLVDLKLTGFDAAAKIKVIKEVRSILNLGLKEAKEMVEGAPVILQKGVKPELAEELRTKLEAAGAKVEVQ
jgi:large subunit ribosomal protein L7/L12